MTDVRLCKRTAQHQCDSHKPLPQRRRFLNLCDEYGTSLTGANLETHGSWCTPRATSPTQPRRSGSRWWEGACVDRVESMLHQDLNHASVLIVVAG